MKQYTNIEVQFILDPTSTWQHLSDFEKGLGDFFTANNMEALRVKTVDDHPGKMIFLVKAMETNTPKLDNKQPEPTKRTDPLKDRKPLVDNSYRKVSDKPLLRGISPYSRPQSPIRYTKDDWKKGHSVVRKIYIKK